MQTFILYLLTLFYYCEKKIWYVSIISNTFYKIVTFIKELHYGTDRAIINIHVISIVLIFLIRIYRKNILSKTFTDTFTRRTLQLEGDGYIFLSDYSNQAGLGIITELADR